MESAPRTTPDLVEGIIEVDSSIDLSPFILAANSLVTEIAATPQGAQLSQDRLKMIETWLSAHFYTVRDPRATMNRVGGQQGAGVEQEYQSKVDVMLMTSHYGQMAMMLDTSGTLRLLSSKGKRTLTLSWLGGACYDVN